MGFAVYECKKCGFISGRPLEWTTCDSRVEYYDEYSTWCPHCKKYLQGLKGACGGCGKHLDNKDVRFRSY